MDLILGVEQAVPVIALLGSAPVTGIGEEEVQVWYSQPTDIAASTYDIPLGEDKWVELGDGVYKLFFTDTEIGTDEGAFIYSVKPTDALSGTFDTYRNSTGLREPTTQYHYEVFASAVYDETGNDLILTAWLHRNGQRMTDATSCWMEIYKLGTPAAPLLSGTDNADDANGVFTINGTPSPALEANTHYIIRARIIRDGVEYWSLTTVVSVD
jgi:hypothetical protein